MDQPIDRRMEPRIVELPRDAQEVREVEVAEPDHVDAVDRRDRIDVLDALAVSTSAITMVRAFAWAILSVTAPPE